MNPRSRRREGPVRPGRGRPRRRSEPALVATVHWRGRYVIVPVTDAISAARLHDQASFIRTRTHNPGWDMTDAAMIDRYRQQYHCEHGFAWLKSGADINPMFIETPCRIASMGIIYCIGLMTWNLIQRTVRAHLTATGTGLPYHSIKPSANITTRFLFELFPSVQALVLDHGNGRHEKQTTWSGALADARLPGARDKFGCVKTGARQNEVILQRTPGVCVERQFNVTFM